jgi:hypothetical protein
VAEQTQRQATQALSRHNGVPQEPGPQ